jgi:hypothetical protein
LHQRYGDWWTIDQEIEKHAPPEWP